MCFSQYRCLQFIIIIIIIIMTETTPRKNYICVNIL